MAFFVLQIVVVWVNRVLSEGSVNFMREESDSLYVIHPNFCHFALRNWIHHIIQSYLMLEPTNVCSVKEFCSGHMMISYEDSPFLAKFFLTKSLF